MIERVEEENEHEQEDETVMIQATSIFSFSLDDVPSCYLQNQSWMRSLIKYLRSGTPLEPDDLTVEVKERADLLLKILITRFKQPYLRTDTIIIRYTMHMFKARLHTNVLVMFLLC